MFLYTTSITCGQKIGFFSLAKTDNEITFETFKAACREIGLLEHDQHWDKALREAAACQSPRKIRHSYSPFF